jgi:hypothetical protein
MHKPCRVPCYKKTACFVKFNFNIILFTFKWLLSNRLYQENSACVLIMKSNLQGNYKIFVVAASFKVMVCYLLRVSIKKESISI